MKGGGIASCSDIQHCCCALLTHSHRQGLTPIQDNPVPLVPDDETLSPPRSASGDEPLPSVPAAVRPPPPPSPDGEDRLPSVPAAEALSLVRKSQHLVLRVEEPLQPVNVVEGRPQLLLVVG